MAQEKKPRLWPLWLLLPLGTVYYCCNMSVNVIYRDQRNSVGKRQ